MARIAEHVSVPDPAVEVWRAPLDVGTSDSTRLFMLLSREEQMRAGRFQFARDRDRYIAARGILRVLLGNCLSVTPAAVKLGAAPYGKPMLIDPPAPLHFNLSHAGGLALYAIARDCMPGVDVERLDRDVDHEGLARRFFSGREYAELQCMPDAERKRAFLTCWTRKEAVAKATGHGLHMPLSGIEVTVAQDGPPQLLNIPDGRTVEWALHAVDAGSSHVATVAIHRAS